MASRGNIGQPIDEAFRRPIGCAVVQRRRSEGQGWVASTPTIGEKKRGPR
ncbi:MAG: hypothetical protein OZSIB_0523 [Candidatus Ozemobacter sibiricus]|uniref:Uncharacterized protein n=1 Tax=Candidatus Ozemobacter sibiricus TaxID=2268124 RepID=A0A367ZNL5_9BACT|nr:MAG: hypothetical protein OZSIB_0523 [Candidatus Ozemobacter sibiricus]